MRHHPTITLSVGIMLLLKGIHARIPGALNPTHEIHDSDFINEMRILTRYLTTNANTVDLDSSKKET